MKCPHCGQEIGISTAALADHAFLLRTQCEECGKEFLIVEGVPMTEEQYSSSIGPRSENRE
jgi:transcriptional regulator NrdR family protein